MAIEFLRVLDRMLGHIRQTGDYFHAKLEGLKANTKAFEKFAVWA